ncbi:MAG: hypothetical protein ACM3YE_10640, partial [Bacteroidota bacterium]
EAKSLVGRSVYTRQYNNQGELDGLGQVYIADARMVVGLNGTSATKLLTPECLVSKRGTLTEAEALIGKKVYIRDYTDEGVETDVIYEVKVSGAKIGEGRDGIQTVKIVIGQDEDGNDIEAEYKDICDLKTAIELKDIWNVVPEEESVE